MPNFWEANPGPRFHGHLKLGEAQSAGYDVHGTFPRDGKLPHISVYEVSSSGGKVERNLYLRSSNGSVGLNQGDRQLLLARSGVSESVADSFVRAVYGKHLELNPLVSSKPSTTGPKLSSSDFPSLPSKPKQVTPPLVLGRPVATIPEEMLTQLTDQTDVLRGVLEMSGAFD